MVNRTGGRPSRSKRVVRKKLAWASIVRDAPGILQLPRAQEDEAKKKCGWCEPYGEAVDV